MNEVPTLWAYCIEEKKNPYFVGGWNSTDSTKFIEQLNIVRSYSELKCLIDPEKAKYTLVAICMMILEPRYKDMNAFWHALHTYDDEVLEREINTVLQEMPIKIALKQFVDRRQQIAKQSTGNSKVSVHPPASKLPKTSHFDPKHKQIHPSQVPPRADGRFVKGRGRSNL